MTYRAVNPAMILSETIRKVSEFVRKSVIFQQTKFYNMNGKSRLEQMVVPILDFTTLITIHIKKMGHHIRSVSE